MTMRGAVGAAACAMALLALGCSEDGGEPDQAAPPPSSTTTSSAPSTTAPTTTTTAPSTTTVAPTTTSTTVPADPFAIPDDPADIDEAYVEAVINEHNRIIGDALRIELAGGDAKEIVDRYNAVFVPEVSNELLTGFFQMTPEDLSVVRPTPGDPIGTVNEIMTSSPECIIANVTQDFKPLRTDDPVPLRAIVLLRRTSSLDSALNRTGWLSEGSVSIEDSERVEC